MIMNVIRLGSLRVWLASAAALVSLAVVSSGCSDKPLGDARPDLMAAGGDAGTTPEAGKTADDAAAPDTGTTAETGPMPACTTSTAVIVGGQPTGFAYCDGILHREQKKNCLNLLPRAQMPHTVGPGVMEQCKSDADCTAQPHGYCGFSSGFIGSYWSCAYGCLTDQDCGAGSVCECGDPVGTCYAATCTTDADCGPGKLCAAGSGDFSAAGSCALRFVCQTAADMCQRRTDCKPNGPNSEYCAVTSSGRKCLIAPQDSPCF